MAKSTGISYEGIAAFVRQYAFQVLGLLVLLANVWIATKLSPVISRLEKLEVKAVEVDNHISADNQLDNRLAVVEKIITSIDKRTERIEGALDRIYIR